MTGNFTFTIDGIEVQAQAGETILEAALNADIYIPHLCYYPDVPPHGSCRVCTVQINKRFTAACTTPAEPGMPVVNESEELTDLRKAVIEMLFVEGNHFCPICEKSGNCELQAIAYRFGILSPRYPYMFPTRSVDATHPDIMLDRNRCIQCGRCVRVSRDLDGKHVFELTGRSISTALAVDSKDGLENTDLSKLDKAVKACPVGAICVKDTAFRTPIGERLYDKEPIGS